MNHIKKNALCIMSCIAIFGNVQKLLCMEEGKVLPTLSELLQHMTSESVEEKNVEEKNNEKMLCFELNSKKAIIGHNSFNMEYAVKPEAFMNQDMRELLKHKLSKDDNKAVKAAFVKAKAGQISNVKYNLDAAKYNAQIIPMIHPHKTSETPSIRYVVTVTPQ